MRSIEVNLKTIRSLNANGTRNIYSKKVGFLLLPFYHFRFILNCFHRWWMKILWIDLEEFHLQLPYRLVSVLGLLLWNIYQNFLSVFLLLAWMEVELRDVLIYSNQSVGDLWRMDDAKEKISAGPLPLMTHLDVWIPFCW